MGKSDSAEKLEQLATQLASLKVKYEKLEQHFESEKLKFEEETKGRKMLLDSQIERTKALEKEIILLKDENRKADQIRESSLLELERSLTLKKELDSSLKRYHTDMKGKDKLVTDLQEQLEAESEAKQKGQIRGSTKQIRQGFER